MTDFAFPQDEGIGTHAAGSGDKNDAANFAATYDAIGKTDYVKDGMAFTVDYATPAVDISAGKAVVTDASATATQTGESRDEGVAFVVETDARTGLSLTDAATNHVFLDLGLTSDDSITFHIDTDNTPPSQPYLKVGEIDTSADSKSELNRAPSEEFESVRAGEAHIDGQIRGQRFTDWYRWRANPVLESGASGEFDENRVTDPKPLVHNGDIWLYYNGVTASGGPRANDWQIGLAKSTDGGGSFTKLGTNPILSPGAAGSWDDLSVADPAVHTDGTDWVMCYIGMKDDGSGNIADRQIGVATSTDGESWTKLGSNPVIDIAETGEYDTGLTKIGTTYHFYLHEGTGINHYTADESDLSTWTDQGEVLTPTESWENGGLRSPYVLNHDGTVYMTYGDENRTGVGLAWSDDGQNWTKYQGNPVQNAGSQYSWEHGVIQDPAIVDWNGEGRLFYDDSAGPRSRIGMMKEDVHSFTRPEQPAFGSGPHSEVALSADQSLTAGTWATIAFDTRLVDRFDNFDVTNNEFVVDSQAGGTTPGDAPGVYLVTLTVRFAAPSAGDALNVQVRKNGTDPGHTSTREFASTAGEQAVKLTTAIHLSRGDTIELRAINENSSDTIKSQNARTKATITNIAASIDL